MLRVSWSTIHPEDFNTLNLNQNPDQPQPHPQSHINSGIIQRALRCRQIMPERIFNSMLAPRNWLTTLWHPIKTIRAHLHSIFSIAISPSGNRFVTGSDDGVVKVWSSITYNCLYSLLGHSFEITDLSISFDGLFLASADVMGIVRVWHLPSGWPVVYLDAASTSHRFDSRSVRQRVEVSRISFVANTHTLLSITEDGMFNKFKISPRTVQLAKYAAGLGYSYGYGRLVSESSRLSETSFSHSRAIPSHHFVQENVSNPFIRELLDENPSLLSVFTSISANPSDSERYADFSEYICYFASQFSIFSAYGTENERQNGYYSSKVPLDDIWGITNQSTRIQTPKPAAVQDVIHPSVVKQWINRIIPLPTNLLSNPLHVLDLRDLSFSPNGHFAAVAAADALIYLFSLQTDPLEFIILPGHLGPVHAISWHPTSSLILASCSDDGSTRIWRQTSDPFQSNNSTWESTILYEHKTCINEDLVYVNLPTDGYAQSVDGKGNETYSSIFEVNLDSQLMESDYDSDFDSNNNPSISKKSESPSSGTKHKRGPGRPRGSANRRRNTQPIDNDEYFPSESGEESDDYNPDTDVDSEWDLAGSDPDDLSESDSFKKKRKSKKSRSRRNKRSQSSTKYKSFRLKNKKNKRKRKRKRYLDSSDISDISSSSTSLSSDTSTPTSTSSSDERRKRRKRKRKRRQRRQRRKRREKKKRRSRRKRKNDSSLDSELSLTTSDGSSTSAPLSPKRKRKKPNADYYRKSDDEYKVPRRKKKYINQRRAKRERKISKRSDYKILKFKSTSEPESNSDHYSESDDDGDDKVKFKDPDYINFSEPESDSDDPGFAILEDTTNDNNNQENEPDLTVTDDNFPNDPADIHTPGPLPRIKFSPHAVWSCIWNCDGSRLITSSKSSQIRVWDPHSGTLLFELNPATRTRKKRRKAYPPQLHTKDVFSLISHPTDPYLLVTAGQDGFLAFWDIFTGNLLKCFIHSALNDPNDPLDPTIRPICISDVLYEVDSPENIALMLSQSVSILDAKFNIDGTQLIISDSLGQITLYLLGSSGNIKSFDEAVHLAQFAFSTENTGATISNAQPPPLQLPSSSSLYTPPGYFGGTSTHFPVNKYLISAPFEQFYAIEDSEILRAPLPSISIRLLTGDIISNAPDYIYPWLVLDGSRAIPLNLLPRSPMTNRQGLVYPYNIQPEPSWRVPRSLFTFLYPNSTFESKLKRNLTEEKITIPLAPSQNIPQSINIIPADVTLNKFQIPPLIHLLPYCIKRLGSIAPMSPIVASVYTSAYNSIGEYIHSRAFQFQQSLSYHKRGKQPAAIEALNFLRQITPSKFHRRNRRRALGYPIKEYKFSKTRLVPYLPNPPLPDSSGTDSSSHEYLLVLDIPSETRLAQGVVGLSELPTDYESHTSVVPDPVTPRTRSTRTSRAARGSSTPELENVPTPPRSRRRSTRTSRAARGSPEPSPVPRRRNLRRVNYREYFSEEEEEETEEETEDAWMPSSIENNDTETI